MNALQQAPTRAPEPAAWDWRADWVALETAVAETAQAVMWDWQGELAALHAALDALEAKVTRRSR